MKQPSRLVGCETFNLQNLFLTDLLWDGCDDRFDLCVSFQPILAQFPARSTLLEASEWRGSVEHVVTIDPRGKVFSIK